MKGELWFRVEVWRMHMWASHLHALERTKEVLIAKENDIQSLSHQLAAAKHEYQQLQSSLARSEQECEDLRAQLAAMQKAMRHSQSVEDEHQDFFAARVA